MEGSREYRLNMSRPRALPMGTEATPTLTTSVPSMSITLPSNIVRLSMCSPITSITAPTPACATAGIRGRTGWV
ncbi:hypothetical protein T492DRAFT_941683 [Pavlovales sp. CCMP2436]|nr:hypothetical protein T492DRAFT_941683 [Pavlovales sp. CCMP2436]